MLLAYQMSICLYALLAVEKLAMFASAAQASLRRFARAENTLVH